MNETKIEYCHLTWNPATGCLHDCEYCYARGIQKAYGLYGGSFEPQFHPKKLDEPSKADEARIIFACDMGDIGSPGVTEAMQLRVVQEAEKAHWHQFLFLSKNPGWYDSYCNGERVWPSNCWAGVSVTKSDELDKIRRLYFSGTGAQSYVQFEPLLEGIDEAALSNLCVQGWPAWFIIGRRSKMGKVDESAEWNPEWVSVILRVAEAHGIPVFIKDNAKWPKRIRQFPAKLMPLAEDLVNAQSVTKG